ncbi:MAG: hypothetical protein AAFY88_05360, partial [Acidobacteriota bacterium]
GLSSDLEAVVSTCLEKVPSRRYRTAGELADDLDRYLDGYPVRVRSGGFRHRTALWVGRNRLGVALAAVAVLAALAVGALWFRQAASARQQARIARDFGAQAEQLSARMQLAHLAPGDDLRPVRSSVRDRMAELSRRMEEMGRPAVGPGHSALGFAALRLGDFETAHQHFESAWGAGYRTEDVALGSAETLSRRYALKQRTLYYLSSTVREVRHRQLRAQLLEPALRRLRAALEEGTGEPSAYVRVLEAYLEDRFDDVSSLVEAALAEEPFRYETLLFEGYAARSQSVLAELDRDMDASRDHLLEARRAFLAAAEVARSDPRVFQEVCETDVSLLYVALRNSEDRDSELSAACRRALDLDPGEPGPHLARANWLHRLATVKDRRGGSVEEVLAEARGHLEKALDAAPLRADAHFMMANHLMIQKDAETWHVEGRMRRSEAAVASARRGAELDPDHVWAPFILGQVHRFAAYEAADAGDDPTASVEEAVSHYRRAAQLAPQVGRVFSSYGSLLDWFAWVQMTALGQDPTAAHNAAVEALTRAAELEPRNVIPKSLLGVAHMVMAEYLESTGGDPQPKIEASDARLREALTLRPQSTTTLSNISEVWLVAVDHALAEGDLVASQSAFRTHRDALERAADLDPDEFGCSLAKSDWYLARIEAAADRDPGEAIARGLRKTEDMLARVGPSRYCQRDRARLLLEDLRRGPVAGSVVEDPRWKEGIALLSEMAGVRENDYQLWDLRADYHLLAHGALTAEEGASPARRERINLVVNALTESLRYYPRRPKVEAKLRHVEALLSTESL